LNPSSTSLATQIEELDTLIAEKGAEAERTSIASLKRKVRETPLGSLAVAPGAAAPAGFVFRDANLRDVLLSLGALAGVNVVFDEGFVDRPVTIDLEDATFDEAFRSLTTVTHNFYRVEGDRLIIIVPDTEAKRREYEQQVTRTFYLSSADLKETIDLLRIVLGARRIAPLTAANALTIVDTPERVKAAETIIESLDKSRSEVIVEMEVLEVNRNRLVEYGIQLRSAGEEGIVTSVFPGDTTLDQPTYSRSNLFVAGLPGAVLSLLRTDGDTAFSQSPAPRRRRVGQAEFGERVPVPITTFTPIATGGSPAAGHDVQYENIGVNILVTPRVHHNNEISLAPRCAWDYLRQGFGGLPTFGNRSVNTVLRLGDGSEPSRRLISDEERTSLNGHPASRTFPSSADFRRQSQGSEESDIVLMMTRGSSAAPT
jgi:general secretion pathway protein D